MESASNEDHSTSYRETVDKVTTTRLPPAAGWRLVHVLVPDMKGLGKTEITLAVYTPSNLVAKHLISGMTTHVKLVLHL